MMRIGLSCGNAKAPPQPRGNRLMVCALDQAADKTRVLECRS